MVVSANLTNTIAAPDRSSGAIIALHYGHEGEQAEITKCGFMGNDFIDISNIVGAGGNMTVQQVGNDSSRKGDPNFMQDLNNAWHNTDDGTRAGLQDCVHLDGNGNVTRIDAIKDHPNLENFVRSFANGMTYIGNGAWAGNPGDPNDNNQSSAGQGSTDIQVAYNDGNANPSGPPRTLQASRKTTAHANGTIKTASPATTTVPIKKSFPKFVAKVAVNQSNTAPNGPGIILNNHTSQTQSYAFYNNYWNGNDTAGANFDHPDPIVNVDSNGSTFVSLPTSFKGRVQRETALPATWVEFQICADNDQAAHGDISLEQGCDGAATISATDGSGRSNGFSQDILSGAPDAAIQNKPDGTKALATTVGSWMSGPNQAAIDHENQAVGQQHAYIQGGTGTDDVASANQCLAVDFY